MARLSATQLRFVAALFGPALGNLKEAAKQVGVDEYSSLMTDELAAEIKKRADNEMIWNVPKAIHTMQNMLENPQAVMNMDKLLKVCTEFLDRAGVSKQDRALGGGNQIGLVFLPSLKPLVEPPDEADDQEVSPEQPPSL